MAMFVHSPAAAVAMMALGAIGTACSDVVVDSIVVERSRGEPQVGFCFQITLYFNFMMALGALGSACSDVVLDTKMLERSCGEAHVVVTPNHNNIERQTHRDMVVDSIVVDRSRGEPQVRLCF